MMPRNCTIISSIVHITSAYHNFYVNYCTHCRLGRTSNGCPPKAGMALSISGCDLMKLSVWSDNRRELFEHIYTCTQQLHVTMEHSSVTRMWANAQRDGRPAEYRWRPLFNAAKFG